MSAPRLQPRDPPPRTCYALEQAGVIVLTDPMAICLDLLPVMDLNKACRNDVALNHLVSELRAWLIRNRPLS